MSTYPISEVADRTGFSAATLRYYEETGVVPAACRSEAGYRVYDERSLDRFAFVARAKRIGLSLEEIGDLAQLWDADECGPVQQRMADLVAHKLADTGERVAELLAFANRLETLAARLAENPEAGSCDETCACSSDAVPSPVADGPGAEDTKADAAIACTLASEDLPGRMSEWQSLAARATGREEIDGGVRLRFPADAGLAAIVADLAQAEQACCAFFDFNVGIGGDAITLDVRAPMDRDVQPIVDRLLRRAF